MHSALTAAKDLLHQHEVFDRGVGQKETKRAQSGLEGRRRVRPAARPILTDRLWRAHFDGSAMQEGGFQEEARDRAGRSASIVWLPLEKGRGGRRARDPRGSGQEGARVQQR